MAIKTDEDLENVFKEAIEDVITNISDASIFVKSPKTPPFLILTIKNKHAKITHIATNKYFMSNPTLNIINFPP